VSNLIATAAPEATMVVTTACRLHLLSWVPRYLGTRKSEIRRKGGYWMDGPGWGMNVAMFGIGVYTWLLLSLEGRGALVGALCGLVLLGFFASAHGARSYEGERPDEAAQSSVGLPWYEYEGGLRSL